MLHQNIQKQIDALAADNESGAGKIAANAAAILVSLAEYAPKDDETRFRSQLSETVSKILSAQPTMAPLFNLANTALIETDAETSTLPLPLRTSGACRDFKQSLKESEVNIHKKAAAIIRDGDTILTHSHSSTVLQTLLYTHRQGRKFNVVCTESRPVNEGVTMARQLAQNGLAVRLIVDAAVNLYISKVQLVLVGADSICELGVVNKIGTAMLALAARAAKTDFYAIGASVKFLPTDIPPLHQDRKPDEEILPEPIPNVRAENFYFEVTPLSYFTGVITENGIMTPDKVIHKLQSINVHPELKCLYKKWTTQGGNHEKKV